MKILAVLLLAILATNAIDARPVGEYKICATCLVLGKGKWCDGTNPRCIEGHESCGPEEVPYFQLKHPQKCPPTTSIPIPSWDCQTCLISGGHYCKSITFASVCIPATMRCLPNYMEYPTPEGIGCEGNALEDVRECRPCLLANGQWCDPPGEGHGQCTSLGGTCLVQGAVVVKKGVQEHRCYSSCETCLEAKFGWCEKNDPTASKCMKSSDAAKCPVPAQWKFLRKYVAEDISWLCNYGRRSAKTNVGSSGSRNRSDTDKKNTDTSNTDKKNTDTSNTDKKNTDTSNTDSRDTDTSDTDTSDTDTRTSVEKRQSDSRAYSMLLPVAVCSVFLVML